MPGHSTRNPRPPSPAASGWRHWLDQRSGSEGLLRAALDEPIPGGARWAYVFGSGLLFLFLSQILTGVVLALYYVPAANDAHVTVAYIVKVVSGGAFLRSLHSYGASAIIVLLLLHIGQTFLYGAYKGRRELVWMAGCALFALMLAMAFTGYLLPWDQKAYFATAVGTNVMGELPGAGNLVKQLLRGGNQMGTVTLSRFFVLHVFVLPGLILALVAAHVYLFRKAGPAGPVGENPVAPQLPTETFAPRQLGRDVMFALLLVAAIGALAYFFPVRLGPEANPADTAFLPRPEWYFLPMFEWLKFWPGRSALIGVGVLPAIVTFLFVAAPFLDRGLDRHPRKRPIAVGGFLFVLGGMVGFGVLSHVQDARDPIVSAQLARQDLAMNAFMRQPFQPMRLGGAPAATATPAVAPPVAPTPAPAPAPASATAAKRPANPASSTPPPAATPVPPAVAMTGDQLYSQQYKCARCHGDFGEGSDLAPTLIGLGWPPARMAAFLKAPSAKAKDAGMPTVTSAADIQTLVAYLQSLK